MRQTDFFVIGGGIAGASAAALLAADAEVVLLEREEQPGYHSTGRSAALFSEIYGNATIRALSRGSRTFLFDPPQGFCSSRLVRPRGTLFIASEEQLGRLDALAALPDVGPATRRLTADETRALCPILRADYVAGGVYEPQSVDLEVHELHHGYLKLFRQNGGLLHTGASISAIERRGALWHVRVGAEEICAASLINAAGAWADEVAALAGIAKVGLQPYQRTVALVEAPANVRIDAWPLVLDIDEDFYVKPDAGLLLLSPADETPVAAYDAQPEELDIAMAVHRAQAAMDFDVRHIKRSWAGLRTFASDRTPVVGYDPDAEGFFWLAGQGGYGIQTAPALARTAASLALQRGVPSDLADAGVGEADISPARFRHARAAASMLGK